MSHEDEVQELRKFVQERDRKIEQLEERLREYRWELQSSVERERALRHDLVELRAKQQAGLLLDKAFSNEPGVVA